MILKNLLDNNALIHVTIIVVATVLALFLYEYLINKYHSKLKGGEEKHWKIFFINSIKKPVRLLIIIMGIFMICDTAFYYYNPQSPFLDWTSKIKFSSISIIVTLALLKFISLLEKHFLKLTYQSTASDIKTKQLSVLLLTKFGFCVVAITGSLATLQSLGVQVQAIIAFASFSGVTLGLAAKEFAVNPVGMLAIYFNKSFNIGDRIKVNMIEGIVENITWFVTQIKLDDQSVVYLPNMQFLSQAFQKMEHKKSEIIAILKIFNSELETTNKEIEKIKKNLIEKIPNIKISNTIYNINSTDLSQAIKISISFEEKIEESFIISTTTNIITELMIGGKFNLNYAVNSEKLLQTFELSEDKD